MSTEARKDNQTLMQKVMLELERKNSALNGALFATFGNEDSRALIFPTPIRVIEKTGEKTYTADEFLMVTNDGYKIIRVDDPLNLKGGNLRSAFIVSIVEDRLYNEPERRFLPSRYVNNELRLLDGILIIDTRGATVSKEKGLEFCGNCKIMNTSDSQVEIILKLNLEREKSLDGHLRRISKVLSEATGF